jgi:hypothetical protein
MTPPQRQLTRAQQQTVDRLVSVAKTEGLVITRAGAAMTLQKRGIGWDIDLALAARRRSHARAQGELRRRIDHREKVAAGKQAAAALAVLRRRTAVEKARRRLDAGTVGGRVDLAARDAAVAVAATAVSRWGGQGDRQPGGDPLDELGELAVHRDARERAATATRFGRGDHRDQVGPPGTFDPRALEVDALLVAIALTVDRVAARHQIALGAGTLGWRADRLLAALAVGPASRLARAEGRILGDLLRLEAVLDYGSEELPTYAREAA